MGGILFHGGVAGFVEIADQGKFDQGSEHVQQTDAEVDVNGLNAAHFGQIGVGGAHESDHG